MNSSSSSSSMESGWTSYFEEFISSQREKDRELKTSSMASDAASHFHGNFIVKSEVSVNCKRLKKRKSKGICFYDDDSLEDTASSPHNSPKVSGISDYLDMNRGKKHTIRRISEINEKEIDYEKSSKKNRDEFDGLSSVDSSSELTELKKKGLCLVPLSMLVDFLEK